MTTINEIKTFVEENSFRIMTEETDTGKLELTVAWINSGYKDDEIDRENVTEELFKICEAIEEKFNVTIEDNTDPFEDERETRLITLI